MLEVWEGSVRATQDFLSEEDIVALRPGVVEALKQIRPLYVIRDEGGLIEAFMGVADGKVEMLFVAAESRGRGLGAALLRHAVDGLRAHSVDVNEQNPRALGFYRRMGFAIVGRSELDDQGRPFPILRLRVEDRSLDEDKGVQ